MAHLAADHRPIRLALCITELRIGGAEQRLADLALRLDRQQFSVEVYSLGPRPKDESRSIAPRLEAAGLPVHCLGGRSLVTAPRVTSRLAAELKRQHAEILLSFLFHANLIGRLAARWARVPRVVCSIRVAERQAEWHLQLDRWTARLVDMYVAVSDSVAEFSRTVGKLPSQRLVVIPNGIDVRTFDQASPTDLTQLGIAAGRKAVTFVGRLDPQKGLAEFISSSRAWLDRLPDHDLLLVGEGPERCPLEALARQTGLSDRVHFAGWRSDVPGILRNSNLLVLPSRWEGMPNVVLEAMGCRLPVVASDVEGVGELLGPAGRQQIAPQGDIGALAERIISIASNPALSESLGEANRRRVEERFSLEAMVDAYSDLLHRLANR